MLFRSAQILRLKEQGNLDPLKKMLIICPAALKRSWYDEFKKFTDLMPVFIGATTENNEYKELKRKGRLEQYDSKEMDEALVIVCNFELILRDIKLLEQIPFEGVAIDEAQRIKGVQSKTTNVVKEKFATHYRYLLTASPMENGLEELWSLADYISPSLFGNFWQFRGDHITASSERRFIRDEKLE